MKHVKFSELCNFTDKQWAATEHADRHRYTLYGGSRGPGKSYWLRWYCLRFLLQRAGLGLRNVRVGLFCEDYPVLRDRQISKIENEFPQWLGTVRESKEQGLAFHLKAQYGGGILALRNLDDPSKYQSAEFALVAVDELTKNTIDTFNVLRGSLRWPALEDTKFIAATNPGGIGHLWVKQLWIDGQFPAELESKRNEFIFVRALPADNPHLSQSYWDELNSLPPDLSRAWVHGDWDVFAGQAFGEWRRDKHVIEPFEIPSSWPRGRAIDWGYAKPFCCLWLCWHPDSGKCYVYREAYQAGLTDREQAPLIRRMTEERENIRWTVADPSMWTKKSHEGLTFSTADEYQAEGVFLEQADNDRLTGIRRVREVLHSNLSVFSTCTNLIRTLPALPYDQTHSEDIDTDAEDHAYDALRYGLMRGPQSRNVTKQRPPDPFAFIK